MGVHLIPVRLPGTNGEFSNGPFYQLVLNSIFLSMILFFPFIVLIICIHIGSWFADSYPYLVFVFIYIELSKDYIHI